MSEELKPCPFCGGKMQPRHALWPSEGDSDGIIHTEPTECPADGFSIGTADEGVSVAEAWNRRASPTPEAIRREALEEAAKVADEMAVNRARVSGVAKYACKSIAARIRALATEGSKP